MMENHYEEYVGWFKDHYGIDPNAEYNKVSNLRELISYRNDPAITKKEKKKYRIITFQEWKENIKFLCCDIFIHETAIIKHPDLIDIGSHNAIDNGVTISTGLKMSNYIHIAPYVCVIGGRKTTLYMEDFSFIAAGTKIVMGSEDYTGKGLVGPTIPIEYRELIFKNVYFHKFSGCGVNCSIMPGVHLAEGSILGANSLLLKDTEPWTIYVGSPAKPIKIREKDKILEYARKLKH